MRMNKIDRREHIIATGVKIANRSGLTSANWSSIAAASSVPIKARAVRHHFPNQRDLWGAIAAHGRGLEPPVIDQARDLGLLPPAH